MSKKRLKSEQGKNQQQLKSEQGKKKHRLWQSKQTLKSGQGWKKKHGLQQSKQTLKKRAREKSVQVAAKQAEAAK